MSDMTHWWGRSFQNKSRTRNGDPKEWKQTSIDIEDSDEDFGSSCTGSPSEEPHYPTQLIQDTSKGLQEREDSKVVAVVTDEIPFTTLPSRASRPTIGCETNHGYCFGTVRNQCDAISLSILVFTIVLLVAIVLFL
jgi:hypothetical protein